MAAVVAPVRYRGLLGFLLVCALLAGAVQGVVAAGVLYLVRGKIEEPEAVRRLSCDQQDVGGRCVRYVRLRSRDHPTTIGRLSSQRDRDSPRVALSRFEERHGGDLFGRWQDILDLPLPAADKEYRIVSRQDTSALDTPPDHDGKLTGHAVKIADSAKFWANSKYLIIVEG